MTLDMEIKVMKRHIAEKAMSEGEKKGEKKGEDKARKDMAIEMIKEGEPIDKISKYCKLTEAAIRKLAKSMDGAV